MISVSKVVSIAVMACVVLGCEKINCDREAPQLEFDTLMLNEQRDSLIYRLAFEDCQGDIGHFGSVDSNTERSVRTRLYELIDGEWQRWYPQNPADSIAFFSVIPASRKNRQGWLLKGVIIQPFGLVNLRQNSDTIRFQSRIIDRAGNRSNWVESPAFIFPTN